MEERVVCDITCSQIVQEHILHRDKFGCILHLKDAHVLGLQQLNNTLGFIPFVWSEILD